MTKERKIAAIISFLSAVGNLGAIVVIINATKLSAFLEALPSSPAALLLPFASAVSLLIAALLFSPIAINKHLLLSMLVASIILIALSAAQGSVALIFMLFWPWSLYKLYRSKNSCHPQRQA